MSEVLSRPGFAASRVYLYGGTNESLGRIAARINVAGVHPDSGRLSAEVADAIARALNARAAS